MMKPFLRGNLKVLARMANCYIVLIVLNFLLFVTGDVELKPAEENQSSSNRRGKLFSLFNIVQFKNSPCVSTATIAGGGSRSGTCFTATECRERGGLSQGTCASGFGVCCVFLVSATGSNVVQNCSYIQNPGFPSMFAEDGTLSYTINKCSSDVCSLRLDFESFTLLGTGAAVDGLACQDQFEVMVTSGQRIPVICGENSGQHIYLDLGEAPGDSAMVQFTFADMENKHWDIKVTQYRCGSENVPSNGCLQYQTGLTGRINTFNYDLNNDNHLPNQEYSICIRQENGYCCVQYQLCQDEIDTAFSLSTKKTAKQDNDCVDKDFVRIPGSSSTCSQTKGVQLTDRYCGDKFNDLQAATVHTTICDCTPPFLVDIVTNDAKDDLPVNSKGLCLEYTQIPCTG